MFEGYDHIHVDSYLLELFVCFVSEVIITGHVAWLLWLHVMCVPWATCHHVVLPVTLVASILNFICIQYAMWYAMQYTRQIKLIQSKTVQYTI